MVTGGRTCRKSALELTNCLKQSANFSWLGRISASCRRDERTVRLSASCGWEGQESSRGRWSNWSEDRRHAQRNEETIAESGSGLWALTSDMSMRPSLLWSKLCRKSLTLSFSVGLEASGGRAAAEATDQRLGLSARSTYPLRSSPGALQLPEEALQFLLLDVAIPWKTQKSAGTGPPAPCVGPAELGQEASPQKSSKAAPDLPEGPRGQSQETAASRTFIRPPAVSSSNRTAKANSYVAPVSIALNTNANHPQPS